MSLALDCIADLDAALRMAGELAKLYRRPAAGVFSIDVWCTLRGYAPSEIIAGADMTQQDQQMVLSPTDLIAGGWPGPGITPPGPPLVPRRGDRIVTASGRGLTIQAAQGIFIGGVLVRIDGRARGE